MGHPARSVIGSRAHTRLCLCTATVIKSRCLCRTPAVLGAHSVREAGCEGAGSLETGRETGEVPQKCSHDSGYLRVPAEPGSPGQARPGLRRSAGAARSLVSLCSVSTRGRFVNARSNTDLYYRASRCSLLCHGIQGIVVIASGLLAVQPQSPACSLFHKTL